MLQRPIYRHSLPILALILALFGCPRASESAENSSKAPKTSEAPKPTQPVFASFDAISTEGLSKEQLASFAKLTNEEICPCNCPKSFAGCLQEGTKCKPAVILGQWISEKLAEGMPLEMMQEPLAKEIGEGYAGAPQIIDIAGYYSRGPANAKYTLVEYADFDCSHCKSAAKVIDNFVDKHKDEVRLVYKYFPLIQKDLGKRAALAAEAAGKQGKFWPMHDALFRSTQLLTEELLESNAKAIGLDMVRFKKDMQDKELVAKVERSRNEAIKLGLQGTPSIFFNGRPYAVSLDMSGFEMRLAMEQARSSASCD